MSIVRIPYPSALPTEQNDYVKQNDLLETGFLQTVKPIWFSGGNILQGNVFQCGGTVYHATGDTAIAGVASDYVKLVPNGDGSELEPEYVAGLAGVTWSKVYNGYYAAGSLYVFDEAKALRDGEIATVMNRYIQQDVNGDVHVGGSIYDKHGVEVTGMQLETKAANSGALAGGASGNLSFAGYSFTPTAISFLEVTNNIGGAADYQLNSVTFGAGTVTINITNRHGGLTTFYAACTAAKTG